MEWRLRAGWESYVDLGYSWHCTTGYVVVYNTWGWDDAWERADFDRRFGTCAVSIIGVRGRAIGGLWLESTPDSLHIVELQLVPEMQGKGIGSAVVQRVIQ